MVRPEEAGEDARVELQNLRVESEFLETLGLELIAGRTFSGQGLEWNDAAAERNAFILNEAAVRQLGWASPEEGIGKQLQLELAGISRTKRGPVIGVVRDFHMASLHQAVAPILIEIGGPSHFAIRIQSGQMMDTIRFIEESWKQIYPEYPFIYSFLDEDFYRLHRDEEILMRLFELFTLLAIFLACLGLFGLTAYTAEQRTHEIGIRKVLGASIPGLVSLLTRDLSLPAVLSVLIAWPVAYLVMNRWLQGFVYRSDMAWSTFLIGGIIGVGITIATVSYQAIRAARANPVDALRYE
jgi:putative ABC transport system permease protein